MTKNAVPRRQLRKNKLDSGELQASQLIARALNRTEAEIQEEIRTSKTQLAVWSESKEEIPGPLDSHLFYVQYSSILNMGYVGNAIAHLGPSSIGKSRDNSWVMAMGSFVSGCTSAYTCLDLLGHLNWALTDANRIRRALDPISWDYKPRYFKKYGELKGILVSFCAPFEIADSDCFTEVRELLRNKTAHGVFNYVVPRTEFLPSHAGKQAWTIIDPRASIVELNAKKDKVGKSWDNLKPHEVLHLKDSEGDAVAVPAPDILRHLLRFCIYAYQEVANRARQ